MEVEALITTRIRLLILHVIVGGLMSHANVQ
jgi:hypothetical protein